MNNEDININEQLKLADSGERSEIIHSCIEGLVKYKLGLRKLEPLDFDAGFTELGLDSVSAVQLTNLINQAFTGELEIVSTDIFDYPTVHKLCAYIISQLNEESLEEKQTDSVGEGLKQADAMSDEDFFKELDSNLGDDDDEPPVSA